MLSLCLIYGILNIVVIAESRKLICGKKMFYGDSHDNIGPKFVDRTAYFTGISCNYTIFSKSAGFGVLEWQKFDVNSDMPTCSKAFVKIYIGCGKNWRYVGKICSRNAAYPFPIYSMSSCIRLEMTGQAGFNPYFKASYKLHTFNHLNSPFTRISGGNSYALRSASGVIASPNWPYTYEHYLDFHKNIIRWYVTIPAADHVEFFVMNMQFDQRYGNSQGDYLRVRSDYVNFKLGYTGRTSLSYQHAKSFSVEFGTNMFGKVQKTGSGFVVGYIAYGRDKTALVRGTTKKKRKERGRRMSIGILILIICISFFLFLSATWLGLWSYRKFQKQINVTQAIVNDCNDVNDNPNAPQGAPQSGPLLTESELNENGNDEIVYNPDRQPLENPSLSLNGPPSYAQLRQGEEEFASPPSYDDVITGKT